MDGLQAVHDPEVGDAAHAVLDVVDDRDRILGARVVRRDDRQVRSFGRDAPHDRTLALVAVAAAAEDDDQSAPGERAERGQRTLQRVRRVGVVAEHDAGRLGEQLHPARHLRRRGEPRGHLGERKAETERARRRGERVRDVEVAQQRQRHLRAAEASLEPEAAAGGVEDDACGPHVGRRVKPEGDRRDESGRTSQAVSSRLTTSTPRSVSMPPSLSLAARYDSMVPW